MSTSFPFLHLARQLGVAYESVLWTADSLNNETDAELNILISGVGPTFGIMMAHVATAVMAERIRRDGVDPGWRGRQMFANPLRAARELEANIRKIREMNANVGRILRGETTEVIKDGG